MVIRYKPLNKVSPSWIKGLREQHGYTCEEMAALCGVKTRTWQRWERGDSPINPCIFHYWLNVFEQRVLPRGGKNARHWNGWRVDGMHLISPSGERYSSQNVEGSKELLTSYQQSLRHMQMLRQQSRNGLSDAGEQWREWKFEGGFLISPDGRKASASELYKMMAAIDAMNNTMYSPCMHPYQEENADVVSLRIESQ